MMSILYLILIILGVSFQNIIKKPYSDKTEGRGVYTFSFLTSLAAMAFYAVTSAGFSLKAEVLVYSLMFAAAFTAATVFTVKAIVVGSLSLTALIVSYSLMIPTFYGLVFLKEPISPGLLPGIALMLLSILLTNKKTDEAKINFKWIVYVSLAAVGNGMCSVVQKMQQVAFDGNFKNEFMMMAMAIAAVILLVCSLKAERRDMLFCIKHGWLQGLSCGIANGAVNMSVMILSSIMSVSIMFPMISVGGIVLTYLMSVFYYKESLNKSQHIGVVLGLISVVFLNI